MTRRNGLHLAGLLACTLLAVPQAPAQSLDPRVLGPLQVLFQAAAGQCQAGNPVACQQAQQLQQAGMQLTQAQGACQMGNQQACMVFQNGAQQIVGAYQQLQMQQQMQGGMAGVPGGGPAPSQGYSTQQMQFDHQQRMQQQQQQFQQHQQMMRQQQQLNDQNHQRFMQQLRQ
jgi:hypothetical protein